MLTIDLRWSSKPWAIHKWHTLGMSRQAVNQHMDMDVIIFLSNDFCSSLLQQSIYILLDKNNWLCGLKMSTYLALAPAWFGSQWPSSKFEQLDEKEQGRGVEGCCGLGVSCLCVQAQVITLLHFCAIPVTLYGSQGDCFPKGLREGRIPAISCHIGKHYFRLSYS